MQVDCEPAPTQNVPCAVHDGSVALQVQAALPEAPVQLWCVPQAVTLVASTHDSESAVQVVTSVPVEQ